MAKRVPKETNVPLVIALVFFVLTTIAFGVMWYMQFSEQQAKDDAVKKAKAEVSAANGLAKEADLKAKLYRIINGTDQPGDRESLMAEHKPGDFLAKELKLFNEKLVEKAKVPDLTKLPPEIPVWAVDERDKLGDAPTKSVFEGVSDLVTARKKAEEKSAEAVKDYSSIIAEIKKTMGDIDKSKAEFDAVAKALPKDYDKKLKEAVDKYEKRKDAFVTAENTTREELKKSEDEKARAERERDKKQQSIDELTKQLVLQTAKVIENQSTKFEWGQPHGRVLRRLDNGVVEISLGSADFVTPTLKFSVMPRDFPERGEESRMFREREPNQRGEFETVVNVRAKANIEVTEVLGPHLSRARLVTTEFENRNRREEYDPIRDGVVPGDLLYNPTWSKGSADHIALIGIFDVNGDGTDDAESVMRDLIRMGVPVDAYFDMRTKQWVGNVTEQTRYIVRGNFPSILVADPKRDAKVKLNDAMTKAVEAAKGRGIQTIDYEKFFGRMGYPVKLRVPAETVSKAAQPYLLDAADAGMPPEKK